MQPKKPVRLLVADDHPVVREGLVAILSTQADFEVVGEAETGSEALRLWLETRPDVLLLDLEMPELDGVAVLRYLQDAGVGLKTLVFTAYDSDERILAALELGVQGYLLKGAPREEIFQAIRTLSAGGSLLEPVIVQRLVRQVQNKSETLDPMAAGLTEREQEVLQDLAEGKSNKEIARELVITERTVKFHVSSILSKLGASNRTEAVKKAVQMKIIQI
ncbi:MAG TPA: response regulator transcription factor [Anaerolineaceae bacterium]|nr:response regulator transcription factor [Anaerolineaceae bacterium]